jgi:4-cresol dehydrogenase (hydroxylating)
LRRRLASIASPRFLRPRLVRWASWWARKTRFRGASILLAAAGGIHALTRGVPDEGPVRGVVEAHDPNAMHGDPDASATGYAFVVPLAPLEAEEATRMLAVIRSVAREHQLAPAITLNTLDDRLVEAVVSFAFCRRDELVARRVSACTRAMNEALVRSGYPPYRVSVDQMDVVVDPSSSRIRQLEALGRVLDPEGIIAPGRYELSRTAQVGEASDERKIS